MKTLLKEIMTNDCGRYSTTNFIQVLSIIILAFGFIYALFSQDPIASEIAMFLAGIAVATPASKGFMALKQTKERSNEQHD